MEAGIRPRVRAIREQMLYGIIVDIIDMMNQVLLIANVVLPKPLLPNAAFAMLATRRRDGCFLAMVSNPLLGKSPLDARPSGGKIAVIFR